MPFTKPFCDGCVDACIAVSLGLVNPPFWDSSAFACNLSDAPNGFRNHPPCAHAAAGILDDLSKHLKTQNLLDHDFSASRLQLQAFLAKRMNARASSCDFLKLVVKRVHMLVGPTSNVLIGESIESLVSVAFSSLRKIRMHEAFQVIRTWVNSWSTSSRYHEDPALPCLFGCVSRPDSPQHYLTCVPMNRLVDSHILRHRPTHPLNRLGLHVPSKEGFLELAATFHAYHAVKLGLEFNPHKLDFVKNHCIFSQAFVAACEAAALPCRVRAVDADRCEVSEVGSARACSGSRASSSAASVA